MNRVKRTFGADSPVSAPAEATVNEMLLLSNTGIELAKYRRQNPGDDLMTSVVNAEVDGHRLTDEEVGAFLILLASAGNDVWAVDVDAAQPELFDDQPRRLLPG